MTDQPSSVPRRVDPTSWPVPLPVSDPAPMTKRDRRVRRAVGRLAELTFRRLNAQARRLEQLEVKLQVVTDRLDELEGRS